jgi:cutinase
MSTSAEIEAASVTQTKRRALGRLSSLVSVTATLACGALLMSPAVAHADQPAITGEPAAYCPDVQVVFARGTGEAPGAGRVGEAFVDSLRAMLTGKSVAVYGVEYPASYDFLRAMDGVSDAGVFISNMAESCPQTKMVLGGYSQGAAVVDILAATGRTVLGFISPLPETVANHGVAVAVFGNPSNRMSEPLTALSPLYGSKAIDLCNGDDPVCSNGNDTAAHSLYVEAGMATQAAQFVAGRLESAQTSQLAAGSS